MLEEFKKFALRGSVVDLAVGVVIGGAFGKIVTSLVNDVIMPPLGLLLGKMDFSNLYINLSGTTYTSLSEAKKAGAATINYGIFINNILDFLIIALAIFLVIRQVNKMFKIKEAPVETKECPHCTSKIPVKATRCPFCTSELETTEQQ